MTAPTRRPADEETVQETIERLRLEKETQAARGREILYLQPSEFRYGDIVICEPHGSETIVTIRTGFEGEWVASVRGQMLDGSRPVRQFREKFGGYKVYREKEASENS